MIFLAIKAAKFIVSNDYLNQFMTAQLQKKQVRNQEAAMQNQIAQAEAQGMMPADMMSMMTGQGGMPGGMQGSPNNQQINLGELEKMAKAQE